LVKYFRKENHSYREKPAYINRCAMIYEYKRVIKEAKKKENDRYIANAKNKTTVVW
jgi:hypothetical protein